MTAQRRYELTDDEWERIKGYFPEREAGQKGRPRNEDRPILNGILWIVRSGAAWRDLPERYGAWSTVYSRFVQWQEEGLFDTILKELSEEADFQDMSIDGSTLKPIRPVPVQKRGCRQRIQPAYWPETRR